MVIWLVGLSGAGKTTLGREVARQWRERAANTVLLDGDELRAVFGQDKGDDAYTLAGRRRNAERITSLCALLDAQGINVVCCILSIFADMRTENRRRYSRYFEVFMDAPLATLQARDVKGLYAGARAGKIDNVVGIDIPFERPTTADMIIDSSDSLADLPMLAAQVLTEAGAA